MWFHSLKEWPNSWGEVTSANLIVRDNSLEIADNLFVGYFSQRFKCRSIAADGKLVLPMGRHTEFGGVDFYYLRYRTAKDKEGLTLPVADVYIVPSGYFLQTGKTSELFTATIDLAKEISNASIEKRLKPVEEQLLALAPMPDKLKYLEARVRDQDEQLMKADTILSNYARASSTSIEEKGIYWTPKGTESSAEERTVWGSFLQKLKPALKEQPESKKEAYLRSALEEQSQLVDDKETTLALATKVDSQVVTIASPYHLTLGGRLSLPGQLPSSSVYIEVIDVTDTGVTVRVQHLAIESK